MDLSIIIVNWNSVKYILNCIKSIKKNIKSLNYEIIVVDNASFDNCGEKLAHEFPEVIFIQSQQNLGFAAGNNLGASHARGEVLLFLNPDTEVLEGAIERLFEKTLSLPMVGIVGPRVLNTDGSLQTSCVRALPTPINRALDANFLRRLFPRSRHWGTWNAFSNFEPVVVEAVSGACMMIKANTFASVGGFNPQFFMYAEDMDLCARIRGLGLKNYHIPEAVVVHHGGGSSSLQFSQFSTLMMRVADETYMKLNLGSGAAILYRFLQMFSAMARIQILLPIFIISNTSRKKRIRDSMKKWFHIFLWCIGASPIRIPNNRFSFKKSNPRSIEF